MDGNSVADEPSDAPLSLTELFKSVFPKYLAMGMSYDEFWHGEPSLAAAYREAEQIKLERMNFELWLNGRYNFEALLCAAPVIRATFGKGEVKPGEYPSEPHPITEKALREYEVRKKKENFMRILAAMEADNARTLQAEKEAKDGGDH